MLCGTDERMTKELIALGTIHGENQGDSAWTGEILDETKSDLEPRKQSA